MSTFFLLLCVFELLLSKKLKHIMSSTYLGPGNVLGAGKALVAKRGSDSALLESADRLTQETDINQIVAWMPVKLQLG